MSGTTQQNILFVTGTDTLVGKTVISCLSVLALRRKGVNVKVMKPVETECLDPQTGEFSPDDSPKLRAAAGDVQPLEEVVPYTYGAAVAPSVAARAEGRAVDLAHLKDCARDIAASCDILVIEGAGGLLVPIAPQYSYADLAGELAATSLVVVGSRLGAISHCLLTLEVIRSRKLECLGYVLNELHPQQASGKIDCVTAQETNRATIQEEAAAYGAEELLHLEYDPQFKDIAALENRAAAADAAQFADILMRHFGLG